MNALHNPAASWDFGIYLWTIDEIQFDHAQILVDFPINQATTELAYSRTEAEYIAEYIADQEAKIEAGYSG